MRRNLQDATEDEQASVLNDTAEYEQILVEQETVKTIDYAAISIFFDSKHSDESVSA